MDTFEGVDLNDSFVLGWDSSEGRLCFELEASLWPQSPHYSEPKSGEYTCYKRATLEFVGASDICGLAPLDSVRPIHDPAGPPDCGNIDSLAATEGTFHLSGSFGQVTVTGGALRFVVHT